MEIEYKDLSCSKCDINCNDNRNLQAINKERLSLIKNDLEKKISIILKGLDLKNDNIVIVTTGSDGRLENLPCASGLELILYLKRKINLEKVNQIKDFVGRILEDYNRNTIHNLIYGHGKAEIEVKNLSGKNDSIILYYGNYEHIFPTRFLDSFLLYGDLREYNNLWKKFIVSLKDEGYSKLRNFFQRINYHKRILSTGKAKYKGNDILHFNLDINSEDNFIFYYKDKNIEKGVKLGPLRYVQYSLAKIIIFLIRRGILLDKDIKELINIDKSIKSKIEYLRNYNKYLLNFRNNEDSIKDFINVYKTFLYIHLILQKKFKDINYSKKIISDEECCFQEIKLILDKNNTKELKEKAEFLKVFLDNLSVKENEKK